VKQIQCTEPKYRQILQRFKDDIRSGKYKPGQRVPSECQLVKEFRASRVTVNRAMTELRLTGVIERRVGSGSYVRLPESREHRFGLLIPDLGKTEIFEPMCLGLAEAREQEHHPLLWGKSPSESGASTKEIEALCYQFISRGVSGVFFAPLEHAREKDAINRQIVETLARAEIAVVLLDRDLAPYPDRSTCDLVSIDNRRAGDVLTQHMLSAGAQKLMFLGRPRSAPTVDLRIDGFRDAILNFGLGFCANQVVRIDPQDSTSVQQALKQIRPDGIVCADDWTAAQVMQVLTDMNISIPYQMKIAGFGDAKYASLLPVPLTTIHPPYMAIGAAALETMVHRLRHPDVPSRNVMLNFALVVRRSTGAELLT